MDGLAISLRELHQLADVPRLRGRSLSLPWFSVLRSVRCFSGNVNLGSAEGKSQGLEVSP